MLYETCPHPATLDTNIFLLAGGLITVNITDQLSEEVLIFWNLL